MHFTTVSCRFLLATRLRLFELVIQPVPIVIFPLFCLQKCKRRKKLTADTDPDNNEQRPLKPQHKNISILSLQHHLKTHLLSNSHPQIHTSNPKYPKWITQASNMHSTSSARRSLRRRAFWQLCLEWHSCPSSSTQSPTPESQSRT
jgi:hypothetical protein